jgi:hypothetical protein
MLVVNGEVYKLKEDFNGHDYAVVSFPTGNYGQDLFIVDCVPCDFDPVQGYITSDEYGNVYPMNTSDFDERVMVNAYGY